MAMTELSDPGVERIGVPLRIELRRNILTVPPSAAERLKERGCRNSARPGLKRLTAACW